MTEEYAEQCYKLLRFALRGSEVTSFALLDMVGSFGRTVLEEYGWIEPIYGRAGLWYKLCCEEELCSC